MSLTSLIDDIGTSCYYRVVPYENNDSTASPGSAVLLHGAFAKNKTDLYTA